MSPAQQKHQGTYQQQSSVGQTETVIQKDDQTNNRFRSVTRKTGSDVLMKVLATQNGQKYVDP